MPLDVRETTGVRDLLASYKTEWRYRETMRQLLPKLNLFIHPMKQQSSID